jgi:hypothetical protein
MSGNRYDNQWVTTGMNKEQQVNILNGQMSSDEIDDVPVGHDHDPLTPGNGGQIRAASIKTTPTGDLTSTNQAGTNAELNVLANLGRVHVPIRQTVLNGGVDGDGKAAFLQQETGILAVKILGAATPIVITFAYNSDNLFGQVDYIKSITTDISSAWTSLTPNTTCFLYIDRNISTGGLTYGFSTLAPTYATLPPSSPSTDQHWFDLNSFYMKRYTGSAWEIKQRVFVGEAVTGASAVTSVITYALKRRYISSWTPVAANGSYTLNHNIGIPIPNLGIASSFSFSLDAAGSDASYAHDVYTQPTTGQITGHYNKDNTVINTRNTLKFGFLDLVQVYRGNLYTAGYYRAALSSSW